MVTHEQAGRGRRRLPRLSGGADLAPPAGRGRRSRRAAARADRAAAPAARTTLNLTSDVLVFLLAVVGGRAGRRALAGAGRRGRRLAAAQLLLHPADRHASPSASANNALALVVFVAVAAVVSAVVDLAARRTSAGRPGRGRGGDPVLRWPAACCAASRRCRRCWTGSGETFGLSRSTLLERADGRTGWRDRSARRPARPSRARRPEDGRRRGAGRRRPRARPARPAAARPRTGGCSPAFAAQAAVALRQRRLAEAAAAGGAARRGRPHPHRAARRRQPRPAHPAGLGQGRRHRAAQRRRRPGPEDERASCWPPRTSRWTG